MKREYEIQNKNDAKIIACLEEHGPCRQREILASTRHPKSVVCYYLLHLEARQIAVAGREPTRGASSLKTRYYLATGSTEKGKGGVPRTPPSIAGFAASFHCGFSSSLAVPTQRGYV